jgi:hypothetical protein
MCGLTDRQSRVFRAARQDAYLIHLKVRERQRLPRVGMSAWQWVFPEWVGQVLSMAARRDSRRSTPASTRRRASRRGAGCWRRWSRRSAGVGVTSGPRPVRCTGRGTGASEPSNAVARGRWAADGLTHRRRRFPAGRVASGGRPWLTRSGC